MCGIAGIVTQDVQKYKSQLKKMTDSLSHRGPDAEGFYFFNDCGLGHRRLSIIDLKTGDQPMLSQSARGKSQIAIVFNGEIYGYQEIKKNLTDYHFQTTSDTEIILALYEKYSDDFLKYLPGMFAFALWDDKEKKLIAARDRFGEKPFYYAFGNNNEFIFASEIKAILASGLIKPRLNKNSLIHYLKRLYVHPYETIYENIYVLPPAHFLVYQDGKIKMSRYWQMPELNYQISLDEAVEEFKKLLFNAVKKQLVADVPVGAFLSGGLDSSTIVAITSQYKENLNTFSFGFGEWINELPYALEIAKKYKTNHIELTPEKVDLGELLIKMQEIYDEPFADSSNIPTYLLAKTARQYTKVVLTGDGGDEMLGGYGWYKPFLYQEKSLSDSFLRTKLIWFIAKVLAKLPFYKIIASEARQSYFKNYLLYRHLGAKFNKFNSVINAHLSQNIIFNDKEIKTLGLKAQNKDDYYQPSWNLTNDLNDVMRWDVENYLVGDILTKIDRASMANGLELRAPFLDVDLASFCLSLPYQLKVSKENDKIILRRAVSGLWTDSIRNRYKQGFGGPVDKWLKEDKSLNALREDYLNNPKRKIFELISFDKSRQWANKNKYKTWTLLVLAVWLEKNNFDF